METKKDACICDAKIDRRIARYSEINRHREMVQPDSRVNSSKRLIVTVDMQSECWGWNESRK